MIDRWLAPAAVRFLAAALAAGTTACDGMEGAALDRGVGAGGSVVTTDAAEPDPVFPPTPIFAGGAPLDAAALFGPAGSGSQQGGPCLVEPAPDTLLPRNWLRPRFGFVPAGQQNLFEIRLKAASQTDDLVVYTTEASWTMPAELWQGVANDVVDEPIVVGIRGAVWDGAKLVEGPAAGAAVTMRVAPVSAIGSIVYWTTTGGSALKAFAVGDEEVVTVLRPQDVEFPSSTGEQVTCIGCHTSTPDGAYASFTAQAPWSNAVAGVRPGEVGALPPYLTPSAVAALRQPNIGIHSYSPAHFAPGDRLSIAPLGSGSAAELAWFDLEAPAPGEGQAFGVLLRAGDDRGAGAPVWSHDGERIAYVSTDAVVTGRLGSGAADLRVVPYAGGHGGAAVPVPGASSPAFSEYYPAFSADDEWLAFDRIPSGENMYDAPEAELFVVSATGGTPIRLDANDPPSCTGLDSPGVTNSWPKWAPEAPSSSAKTYHWLVFSSRRFSARPQLYMTAVVVDEASSEVHTHGAVYLWNQPADESNHTPAWDVMQVPPPH